MVKVKLRKTKKYFEDDDTSFYIHGNQILELPEKHLRSYSIKKALFHGDLLVVEGEFVLKFKDSKMYVAKDVLYCYEAGKYFLKNLETDTIEFLNTIKVPMFVRNKLYLM